MVDFGVQKMILSPVYPSDGAPEPWILLVVAGAIGVYMDIVVLPVQIPEEL